MPTVWVPSLMQKLTGGNGQVEVEGETVRQIIEALEARYPGFKDRLCEEPSLMQKLTGGNGQVEVEGETVRQIIEALEARYPGFKDRLCEDHQIA